MSKLQSLADRPATKGKITDCVCSLDETCEFSRQVESELSKLRDLLDEAREIINYVAGNDKQYSMKLKAENWLKDLSEVCGE
jgi:hypothetical protein